MIKPHLPSFRIRRCIEHDGIRLRPLRITDAPLVRKGLWDEDALSAGRPGNPLSPSCLSLWWWLKKTYTILFCIEVESKCVGFIGLYNLEPGESAEITLVILERGMRRRGCGSRAYTVFVTNLHRSSFIKKIIARVSADNHPSISFWKKLGFEELSAGLPAGQAGNDIQTMTMDLGGAVRAGY